MVNEPVCSVIVATYNRSSLLVRLLQSLRAQDLEACDFEVLVVDDGSTDDTQAVLAAQCPPFRLVRLKQSNQGPAAARNSAIAAAGSDLIVCLDDDVIAAPNLLRRHVQAHQAEPRLAAFGAMLLPPDRRLAPWLEWEAHMLTRQYEQMQIGAWQPTPRQFYTANASFPRALALEAGLFDPDFRRAEDVEFAHRLADHGAVFRFLEDAIVHHQPDRNFQQWLRVPEQYGYYDYVMAHDKGRAWVLDLAVQELQTREPLVRLAAETLIGRRVLQQGFVAAAGLAAAGSARLGLGPVSRASYSAIFNLQYWQGVCDALGGRRNYLSLLQARSLAEVAPAGA